MHIVETAHSLLLSSLVPSEFLGEAILTAVNLINKILSSHTLGLSPFEKLYGYAPDYSSIRVFGSTCFVILPHEEHSKFSFSSTICVFLGYGEGQKEYRCFDPVSQKLYCSRYVMFLEHIHFFLIPATTHNLTKSDLIHIDPFSDHTDSLSLQVPSTIDSDSSIAPIIPFPLHYSHKVCTISFVNTSTSLELLIISLLLQLPKLLLRLWIPLLVIVSVLISLLTFHILFTLVIPVHFLHF